MLCMPITRAQLYISNADTQVNFGPAALTVFLAPRWPTNAFWTGENYRAAWYEHLDRALTRPQLAGIGISECVGAGIFVTSDNLIAVTGSLGGVLRRCLPSADAETCLNTTNIANRSAAFQ
ncbi:hypothetical protein K469DRAFT_688609 [Zopfia rhizophila CBS 207.26]|uniref:Uncharacterized protein n=1 Tax=Zopfia rhizophila CBS 207.26 TaxID=1314779 RepID=A0A6A6DYG8_9PEZI|nr:hypothetical protein K469DRAFT_688609 [Zopfia rhizophila CBS 207.26]